jgi:hypothetical protein
VIVLITGPVDGVPISQCALLNLSFIFGSIFALSKLSGGPEKFT